MVRLQFKYGTFSCSLAYYIRQVETFWEHVINSLFSGILIYYQVVCMAKPDLPGASQVSMQLANKMQ